MRLLSLAVPLLLLFSQHEKFLRFFFKQVRRNDLGWGIDPADPDDAVLEVYFVCVCDVCFVCALRAVGVLCVCA